MFSHKANHLLLCFAFIFQPFCCFQKAHAQKLPTLEKILEIWKQRQDNTRSVDFQIEQEQTYAKGSMRVFNGPPQPPTDVTQTSRSSIQVDGGRMRVWSNAPPWDPKSGKFVLRDHLSTFDGKDEKVFYDQSDPAVQASITHKTGIIGIHQYNQDVVDYHLWPVLLTYRPLHRDMGRFKDNNEWEMTGERGVAEGRDCLILRKNGDSLIEKCWLDFERDCTIVRYEFIANFRFQIDVTYKNDSGGFGWIPVNWKTVEYLPKGTLNESSRFNVTGYTINKKLPEDWFHFDFPVGTEVRDNKNKQDYIVKEGGVKRLITEAERERGVTYEELLTTDSGQTSLPSPRRRSWHTFLLCFIGVVLLSVIVWRKRMCNVS